MEDHETIAGQYFSAIASTCYGRNPGNKASSCFHCFLLYKQKGLLYKMRSASGFIIYICLNTFL
jgi:hypothetical protein